MDGRDTDDREFPSLPLDLLRKKCVLTFVAFAALIHSIPRRR